MDNQRFEIINRRVEKEKRIMEKMKSIKYKIAIMSGKGGVGKTTIAVNLAVALAEEGFNVGLLDVDVHGPNVARMLGVEESVLNAENDEIIPFEFTENLKIVSLAMVLHEGAPVIWRGPLKHTVLQQFLGDTKWGKLDFLIFDLPPGTGDEALSLFQLVKMDGVVVVTTPQEVAIDDVRRTINFVFRMKQKVLGLVENMSYLVCPRCGEKIELFGKGGAKKLSEEFKIPIFSKVPFDPRIPQLSDTGKPVISYYRNSSVEKSFRELVKNILEILEK